MAGRPSLGEVFVPVVVAGFAVVTGWAAHEVKLTVPGAIAAYGALVALGIGVYVWRQREYRVEKGEEAKDKENQRREREEEKRADTEAALARETERDARLKRDRDEERAQNRRDRDLAGKAEHDAILAKEAETKFEQLVAGLDPEMRSLFRTFIEAPDSVTAFSEQDRLKSAVGELIRFDKQKRHLREEYQAAAAKWINAL